MRPRLVSKSLFFVWVVEQKWKFESVKMISSQFFLVWLEVYLYRRQHYQKRFSFKVSFLSEIKILELTHKTIKFFSKNLTKKNWNVCLHAKLLVRKILKCIIWFCKKRIILAVSGSKLGGWWICFIFDWNVILHVFAVPDELKKKSLSICIKDHTYPIEACTPSIRTKSILNLKKNFLNVWIISLHNF